MFLCTSGRSGLEAWRSTNHVDPHDSTRLTLQSGLLGQLPLEADHGHKRAQRDDDDDPGRLRHHTVIRVHRYVRSTFTMVSTSTPRSRISISTRDFAAFQHTPTRQQMSLAIILQNHALLWKSENEGLKCSPF